MSVWRPRDRPGRPFFIHGLGDYHSLDGAINLVKSREFKEVATRSGSQARPGCGLSTHHKDPRGDDRGRRSGGIVDAIMLQYAPWLAKDARSTGRSTCLKKASLITMKQIAASLRRQSPGEHPRRTWRDGSDPGREEADAYQGLRPRDMGPTSG